MNQVRPNNFQLFMYIRTINVRNVILDASKIRIESKNKKRKRLRLINDDVLDSYHCQEC